MVGNIHYTDGGHAIGGEYRLNTYRVKQWIRLSLENPVYYMTRLVSGVTQTLLSVKLCQYVPHMAHFVVTVILKVKGS